MSDATYGYRAVAKILHWGIALLILAMILAGFAMIQEELPQSLRNKLFVFHKNIGLLVFAAVVVRLAYRLIYAPPALPDTINELQRKAAAVSHFALYVLMLAMPVFGYVRVKAGGFPIESLDAWGIPSLVPRSDELASLAKTAHYLGAIAIAALILIHIAAALHHALILKDGVFQRMWFGRVGKR